MSTTPWLLESEDEYHSKAGEYLSSHLIGIFMDCPALYKALTSGELRRPDTQWFAFGRAAHTLIFQGTDRFLESYVVGGPINPSTGLTYGKTTKKFEAWLADMPKGVQVLSEEECAELYEMKASVDSHSVAGEFIKLSNQGAIIEGVIREPWLGEPCQIRVDWWHQHGGLVDLKTCQSLSYFERDVRKYNYCRQLAFYRAVLSLVGLKPLATHLIAVEKKIPYRVGVWRISESCLEYWEARLAQAVRELQGCRESNHFPSGFEEVIEISVLPEDIEVEIGDEDESNTVDSMMDLL